MTKYTDTNANWESEQREELITEAKRNIVRLENRKATAFARNHWHGYDSNAKYRKIRALIRYYDRQIAKEVAFLKSEGIEVKNVITFW